MAEDTFGPVADNAAGIAEMTGEFEGEPERIMDSLDAVGNTTKAVTKGFAIGSAVIAAVALFASFIETIGRAARRCTLVGQRPLPERLARPINVADPKIFIGLLDRRLGRLPVLVAGHPGRGPHRRHRRAGGAPPVPGAARDHGRHRAAPTTARSSTSAPAASLRELATPALLAVLTPVVIGFGIGDLALGGFLAAAILTGQLMANFLSNAGGAWDNAKKYIEEGNLGGKGSEAHKAAVIGDTVGDPFKDTAGPAFNPLIKVMNLVSLLVLPAIITLQHNNAARYAIAAVALVIILAGVAFSKRNVESVAELGEPTGPAVAVREAPASKKTA